MFAVLQMGNITSPRGQKTTEIISPLLILENQSSLPIIRNNERKLNYAFQIVETLQYFDGVMDVDRICWYNSKFKNYVNESTNEFDGAYGPRIKNQIDYCYNLLKKDSHSRQAIISIYNQSDHHESKDIPCTLTLQFFSRNNKLDLVVNMRSNDLMWGTPYDIIAFTFIQHVLASWLKIYVGNYYHHVGSLHVYDITKEKILRSLNSLDFNLGYESFPFTLSEKETRESIKEFWKLEKLSRISNVKELHELKEPFKTFIKVIYEYNERKHSK